MVINISQSFFIKLCCGIFFLQAIVASALPGHSLQSLNAQSQQDVLVICTGSQIKWIAAERYFDFGEIIEVMPPSDIDETQLLFACPEAVANDHKPFSLAFANLLYQHQIMSFNWFGSYWTAYLLLNLPMLYQVPEHHRSFVSYST